MCVPRRCSLAMEAAVLALFLELSIGCHGFKQSTYQIKAAFPFFPPFTQLDLLVPRADPLDCTPLSNPAVLQQSIRAEQQTLQARAGAYAHAACAAAFFQASSRLATPPADGRGAAGALTQCGAGSRRGDGAEGKPRASLSFADGPTPLHHNTKISDGWSNAKSGYSDRQSNAKKL